MDVGCGKQEKMAVLRQMIQHPVCSEHGYATWPPLLLQIAVYIEN
jgi:hypothetical protein